MDIVSFRVLKAVAEEGSVSRAADRLCYVPSNVTTRIRQMEDELGVSLFHRKPRGMVLTSAGKTLLAYAEKTLRLFDEAKRAVRDTEHACGELAVGATASAATVRLPSVFARFSAEYPDVDLNFRIDVSDRLVESVFDHQLDVAVVIGAVNHPDMDYHHLYDEELVIATGFGVDNLDDLERRVLFVAPSGCSQRARLEQWFHDTGVLPFKVMEINTLETKLSYVAAGMGITVAPLSTVHKLGFAGKLKIHRFPAPYSSIETCLVHRKDAIRTKALNAFIETVMNEKENERKVAFLSTGR